jgi:hypothetical protein
MELWLHNFVFVISQQRDLYVNTREAAEQPQNDQDDDNQAENTAKARRAVTAMGVVTAAASKEQDEYDDNKNEAQGSPV